MGHPARPRRSTKSKPLVTPTHRSKTTVGAIESNVDKLIGVSPTPAASDARSVPQQSELPLKGPLASFNLSDQEWDSLFCLAVKHHFEQEKVWVPSVLRTMPLLEGINDKTGRRCRIYVRPGRRLVIVETLS